MAIYDRVCKDCNAGFRGGPRAFYCFTCRDLRKKESKKLYTSNVNKRFLGSVDKCVICDCEYIVNSARQKYCKSCAPIQLKLVDASQSLDYYHNHKDDINLYRSMTRYQDKECVICGRKFKTKTPAITCGYECNTFYHKKMTRIYNSKKGPSA